FIAPLSVEYVILAKEVDWEKYLYLEQQKDLELVMDTPHLQVFLNHSYSQYTTTIRESAQSLDWSLEEIDNIESSLVRYDDAQGAGTGYIVSFMLLAGILIYLPFDKGPSHHKQLSKIRCTRIRSKS
ncbi:MAG: hypothetical protein GY861_04285, partial [bacterium]|nr:hypothetical protein [bacterium]